MAKATGAQIIKAALAMRGRRCRDWPLSRSRDGYGLTSVNKKTTQVHRHICRVAHGEPPTPEHMACHSCDNPACINPHHLSWKTHAENMADRQSRSRQVRGVKHHKAKLTETDVREIKRRLKRGECPRALALEYGVVHGSIWFIEREVTWKHVA